MVCWRCQKRELVNRQNRSTIVNVGFEDAAKSSQVVLDIARSSISTFREHDFAAQIHICHVAVLLRRCRRS